MSVKSDRWILKMCRENGMIKPFEPKLVREVEGRRIISAGVSSYGYDLRLAPDGFRVFSPIARFQLSPSTMEVSDFSQRLLSTKCTPHWSAS